MIGETPIYQIHVTLIDMILISSEKGTRSLRRKDLVDHMII